MKIEIDVVDELNHVATYCDESHGWQCATQCHCSARGHDHDECDCDANKNAATLRSIASRLAAPAGDGWRDIASAPRDGSRILVGYFNFEGRWVVHEAWWRMPYESAPRKDCWWCHDKDGTLLSADLHFSPEGKRLGATYWQPLPAPPSGAKGETK